MDYIKIPKSAQEKPFCADFLGLHFRTDRIIQNQQINDAASRRRHLVPIKIASAKVSPSETQPGRSGTTTVQPSFASQG